MQQFVSIPQKLQYRQLTIQIIVTIRTDKAIEQNKAYRIKKRKNRTAKFVKIIRISNPIAKQTIHKKEQICEQVET